MRQRIPGSSYPTLASSLLVEAIFNTVVAATLVGWAIHEHLFPGLDVLPRLPSIDWLWAFHHPHEAGIIVAARLRRRDRALRMGRAARRGVRAARGAGRRRSFAHRATTRGASSTWQVVEWPLRLPTLGLFLHAFAMPATVRNTLLTQATQSVATALPLTPAGIGTEQALLVYIFLGSAPTPVVLSFSVGMKVVLIVVNFVVGPLHWC